MSSLKYIQFEPIDLSKREHPEYDEKWIQGLIAANPSILGLGEHLVLWDKERPQPHAGRLDISLQEREADQRYEVEVQLGSTDSDHIIRTIERWESECKLYPQYDHTAVIVAEDIPARFQKVVSLLNGFLPLMAIQMKAGKSGDEVLLQFTQAADQMNLGHGDKDEVPASVARQDWETLATPETVALADRLLELIHAFAPSAELDYTTAYIGLTQDGQPNNFVTFVPKKKVVSMDVFIGKSDDLENKMSEKKIAFALTEFDSYKVTLSQEDVQEHSQFLTDFMKKAFDEKMKK